MIPHLASRLRHRAGILIVDDDRFVRDALQAWLHRAGFAVWSASDGREAVDLYRRHRQGIIVVLLDVYLPGPDGPATLHVLQQLNPAIRVCCMSGDLNLYTSDDLLRLGAVHVFAKPFHPEEMLEVLEQIIHEADETRTRLPASAG